MRASWLRGRAAGGAHLAGSKAGTLKVRASPAVEGPAQLIWAKDAMLTYDRMSLVLTGLIRIVLSNKSATEMNEGSKILNSQLGKEFSKRFSRREVGREVGRPE